jgi:quercetin dioxygenase-like cupin family protein
MSTKHMAEPDPRPVVVGPGEGQAVNTPAGGPVTYKARGEQTGAALSAWESTPEPGEGPPVHVHADEDEFIYVIEGRLRFILGEAMHAAPAGSFVFIPKGLPHTWQNVGDETARFLFVFTPAAPGMERFFASAAELPDDARRAEGFKRFAGDAGMEVVGPPLAESDPE